MENTTLGIPAIHQSEALHGTQFSALVSDLERKLRTLCSGWIDMNATIFPSPIAMGCSFNVPLVKRVAERTNYEAVALGVSQLFSPVLDLAYVSSPITSRVSSNRTAFSLPL